MSVKTLTLSLRDAMAMLQVTDQFIELMDKEMVIVTKEKVTIKNFRTEKLLNVHHIQLNLMQVILKKVRILIIC